MWFFKWVWSWVFSWTSLVCYVAGIGFQLLGPAHVEQFKRGGWRTEWLYDQDTLILAILWWVALLWFSVHAHWAYGVGENLDMEAENTAMLNELLKRQLKEQDPQR